MGAEAWIRDSIFHAQDQDSEFQDEDQDCENRVSGVEMSRDPTLVENSKP